MGVVCVLLAANSSDAKAYRWSLRLPAVDRRVIATVLPGSSVRLTPAAVSGRQLTIRATRSWPGLTLGVGRPARVGRSPSEAEVAEFGWRAEMAAAFVASRVPVVTSFAVQTPGKIIPDTATDELNGELRGRIGVPVDSGAYTRLDTLPVTGALAQLNSSLEVVHQAYGPGVQMQTNASIVPLNAQAYGVQATIRVHRLAQLRPHIIDIIQGLQTGLTGTLSAPVEGLAIVLVDDHGQQAGIWINTRGGSGENVSATSLDTAPSGTVDTTFPNLTGGPPTLGSVHL
jgi:hypothetical protein